jgi:hypothetical protein
VASAKKMSERAFSMGFRNFWISDFVDGMKVKNIMAGREDFYIGKDWPYARGNEKGPQQLEAPEITLLQVIDLVVFIG